MNNVVLLAIDGSEGSRRALEHARNRAKLGNAKVLVAYVIEWSPYSFNTPEENAARHTRREAELERAKSTIIEPALKFLEVSDVACDSIVHHGPPAETILKIAKDEDVVQIVIGRRGESGIKALLFGSVAANLIQTSPVPVLVVP